MSDPFASPPSGHAEVSKAHLFVRTAHRVPHPTTSHSKLAWFSSNSAF